MRVIAGSRRSLPLKAPKGQDTRPTEDRTKETLFNVLQNDIYNARFLDLFAGSGSIAIEALSRGAALAVLVENNAAAANCIKENLNFTKFTQEAVLMQTDVYLALEKLRAEEPFDIIFMDPPYKAGFEPGVIDVLSRMPYVTEDTIIVIEASRHTEFEFLDECGFEIYKSKVYKTSQHVFIRRKKTN